MATVDAIPIPLPHVGSVNAWLLRGDPVTLIDTGPRSDEALDALERGLRLRGMQVEDIELVIATHHHHDHVGLAATIKRRAGARLAALDATAAYGQRYAENVAADRRFSCELMHAHGVPDALGGRVEALWEYIAATSERFDADICLHDGARIRAGGRELEVIARRGHSETDTLLVDAAGRTAFVGDHLLAKISPNTEIRRTSAGRRSRSRVDYLAGLKRTARMPVRRLHAGHGPVMFSAREPVRRELVQHRRRCRRIISILEAGPATAFAIGRILWRDAIVREQPLLVVWEVLGHLDLLLAAGVAHEHVAPSGDSWYSLARHGRSPEHGAEQIVHAS